jgi:O-antigen/teichoic acid export membrane protein
VSVDFIKEHLYLGIPLIITTLISGSGQYIDGVIISAVYRDPAKFALFRYGAKEFPLVLMLANGLNAAMLSEFSTREKMRESIEVLRVKSTKLMHLLFPATMLMMLLARWIYPIMFRQEFEKSSGIFLVYALLIIPRLVFPQTIVIGRKKTHITMLAAIIEIVVNVALSLLMLKWGYKMVGVAISTFVAYVVSNLFLILYVWVKMKIKPAEYIPLKVFALYSFLIGILFILIDHRIIYIH